MVAIPEGLAAALADRYRIERELGAGGMATVYLAEDLKHHRQVAVKVLHPELAAVLGAERFLAEIRTTANLQHPHILPLHDSGQADGLLFYVMPYVEGETLRTRLQQEQQLPIEDAVRITREVAGALDYAHRHGVIHRDIKPENILLHEGQALIADFGIALAVRTAGGLRMTQTGMSLGTPEYMSPEQALGERTVTAKSDIYALGCVLYEMLTGEPPFTGATVQAIVAKVMHERPVPPSSIRDTVPAGVEAAVLTALAKLPADRWSSAAQFAEALEGDQRASGPRAASGTAGGTGVAPHRRRDSLVVGLGIALVAATAFGAWQWRAAHRTLPDLVLRVPIEMPRYASSGMPIGSGVAISRTGGMIAYIAGSSGGAGQQLFLRAADDVRPRALAGTETAQSLWFSPDGKWLGYWVSDTLQKVPVDGGSPIPLAEMPQFRGASWSPTGVIVASDGAGLFTIPETGGPPRRLSSPDTSKGEHGQRFPVVLPDGGTVLYSSIGDDALRSRRIGVVSLASRQATILDLAGAFALGVMDGCLVYASNAGDLMAVRFDAEGRRVLGAPVRVADGAIQTYGLGFMAALSESGSLVAQFGSRAAEVVLVDRSGGTQPLIKEPRQYLYPRFSPDGKRLALSIESAPKRDIWLYDLASQTLTRLTNDGGSERPEWSADGTRVLYRTTNRPGAGVGESSIWWRPADLGAPAAALLQADLEQQARGMPPTNYWEAVMTADGRALVAQVEANTGRGPDVAYRRTGGDTTTLFVAATTAQETQPRPSPDGRWVAFRSDASGTNQVLVRPLPGPGGEVVISTTFGTEPVWSRDGNRLYYRDGQQFIEATLAVGASLAVSSRTPLFADPFLLAQSPHANYDIAPDGQQFVFLRSQESSSLMLIHNWRAELRNLLKGQVR